MKFIRCSRIKVLKSLLLSSLPPDFLNRGNKPLLNIQTRSFMIIISIIKKIKSLPSSIKHHFTLHAHIASEKYIAKNVLQQNHATFRSMLNPSQELEDLRTLCFDEEGHCGSNYPPTKKSLYTRTSQFTAPPNCPVNHITWESSTAPLLTHENHLSGCASPGRVDRSNMSVCYVRHEGVGTE